MSRNEVPTSPRERSSTTRLPVGRPKTRGLAALAAALTLAAVLGGCVVYPAGPGWGYHDHWHDHDGWR